MTIRVAGSNEVVEQVFWLDVETKTAGVLLKHPGTGRSRGSERPVADFFVEVAPGVKTFASAELRLANRAQVIIGEQE